MHHQKGNMCCPVTGFNLGCHTGLWKAMFVMAVWFLLFGWIWHTKVLADLYQETASLWRPKADFAAHMYWLWGGVALAGAMAAQIFVKGCQYMGCREGLRYGIIMTIFVSSGSLVCYATQPIPMKLLQMWIAGNAIQYIVGGFLLAGLCGCCKSHCDNSGHKHK